MQSPNPSALGHLLRSRVDEQFPGPGGHSRFRALLAKRFGLNASRQNISHWLGGTRTPEPGKLIAMLDALDVHGDERVRAMRLAWGHHDEAPGETAVAR